LTPLISIVIPVKNGRQWLPNLFDAYSRQTLKYETEIVVVDSGSSDDSVKLCQMAGARVHSVSPEAFNHGLTRDLGASLARGSYILMTVQDAVPESPDFLERMLSCFDDDQVMAVCGLQIVPEQAETNPLYWYRPVSQPTVRTIHFENASDFDRLSPAQQVEMCSWDDVCSMYRKEILTSIPFGEIGFGEDMRWCRSALRAGTTVRFNPSARVFHFHAEEREYAYKRALTEIFYRYKIFGYVPPDSSIFLVCLRVFYRLLVNRRISWSKKIHWFFIEIVMQRRVGKAHNDFVANLRQGPDVLEEFFQRSGGKTSQAPAAR
jgi:rhamnosyltransferase